MRVYINFYIQIKFFKYLKYYTKNIALAVFGYDTGFGGCSREILIL